MELGKEVISCNPVTKEVKIIGEKDVQKIKRRIKGATLKFLTSKIVGVIVTTKPGQSNLKKVKVLEKKYPDKEFHVFGCETLDFNELENFPFIECWVNTMCLRIGLDDVKRTSKSIVNVSDVLA